LSEIRELLRSHPLGAVIAVLGAAWTVGVLVIDAYHLFEFGSSLPPQILEAIGLVVFFAATLSMLAKTHARLPTIPKPPSSNFQTQPNLSIAKTANVPAISNESRIFAQVSPEYLMDMVKDKMSTERDRLTQPFIGKWMNIDAVVHNVSTGDWRSKIKTPNPSIPVMSQHDLEFLPEWNQRLEILTKGQKISVRGIIKRIDSSGVDLENCELI
jgi:hypothetical protein